MDPTTLKIAMAALLHDIGKFADRDCLQIEWRDIDETDKQLYLPYRNDHYSHLHALYTALWIGQAKVWLPLEAQQDQWGEGEPLTVLAAGHHKPATPLQWVVTMADRVSSGWDREAYDNPNHSETTWKEYKSARMLCLFEQLSLEASLSESIKDRQHHRYSLAPISSESIFPQSKEVAVPESKTAAADQYRDLYDSFSRGFEKLRHRDNILLWLEHFDSLLMTHTSSIPSDRGGKVLPDVSLYDHSRATAALAPAIFQYHRYNQSLTPDAIQAQDDAKLLFIQGDFQGIQNFIFDRAGVSQRHRSKLLRGRSLAVSIMTELAAYLLCRRLDLPVTSVLLNAAGKFTLVAPNIPSTHDALKAAADQINSWLVANTYGETRIVLSAFTATCGGLVSGRFSDWLDRFGAHSEEQKFTSLDLDRFSGPVTGYLDSFHKLAGRAPICSLCGKRPSLTDAGAYFENEQAVCTLCRDHVFLGTHAVKQNQLTIWDADRYAGPRESALFNPLFGVYQVAFVEGDSDTASSSSLPLRWWHWADMAGAETCNGLTLKSFNGYVPTYRHEDIQNPLIAERKEDDAGPPHPGDPMLFNHIAAFALKPNDQSHRGTEALGVLKADIDFLGALLTCGLSQSRHTLSRVAALSRQINWFFTLYLPHLLANNEHYRFTYTVFAGGDDLFLIGPWNHLLELASEIEERFRCYVCKNPHIHLSAGLTLHKVNTPINQLAEAAEAALSKSKDAGRNRFTLFDETITWDELSHLKQAGLMMNTWLDDGWVSRVFLYRLNAFIVMAGRERKLIRQPEVSIDELACTKWRSLLTYAAERNVAKAFKGEERQKIVRNVTGQLTQWLTSYGSNLKIPLWTILYNRR